MKNNFAVWLILIVLVVFVGHYFQQEHEAKEALKNAQLEMEINERQADIDTLENYLDFCEESEICE
jgi:hypothetical protein